MEERVIDEFGVILVGVHHRGARGGALPLYTQDEMTAIRLRKWVIEKLIPASGLQFTVSEPYLDELTYHIDLRLAK